MVLKNIVPKILETYTYTTQTIKDNSLEPGAQVIKQIGEYGYKTVTYKEKVLNGAIISREVISNDLYKPMTRIVVTGPGNM